MLLGCTVSDMRMRQEDLLRDAGFKPVRNRIDHQWMIDRRLCLGPATNAGDGALGNASLRRSRVNQQARSRVNAKQALGRLLVQLIASLLAALGL